MNIEKKLPKIIENQTELILDLLASIETVMAIREIVVEGHSLYKNMSLNFLYRLLFSKLIIDLNILCNNSNDDKCSIQYINAECRKVGLVIDDKDNILKQINKLYRSNNINSIRNKHIAHKDIDRLSYNFKWDELYELCVLLVKYSNLIRQSAGMNIAVYTDGNILLNLLESTEKYYLIQNYLRGKYFEGNKVDVFEIFNCVNETKLSKYKSKMIQ